MKGIRSEMHVMNLQSESIDRAQHNTELKCVIMEEQQNTR